MDQEIQKWKEKIPSHWVVKRLEEVCEILDNFRKPINSSERQNRISGKSIENLYPYYGATGQVGLIDDYLLDGEFVLIGEDGAPFLDIFKNKAYKIKGKSWVNNHAHILKGKEDTLLNEFAYYYLNSIKYDSFVNGTTRLKLTKSSLVSIPFLLPPLAEQQTIVAKIEELFSELEKGKEQLEMALAQLKVYRQSLLQAAFENNDYPILNLLDVTTKIQIGPFGTQLHKEDYVENGVPLINPMHIQNGKIIANNSYSISEEKKLSLPNYILKEGDVILGRRGEMGRCGLVTKNEEGWFCGTGSLYIRPKELELYSKYLYYYLSSQTVKKYLELNAGGTTMANLNLKIVNELPLRVPKIDIQLKIVNELESKLTICDKIEETIKQSLAQADVLRQSILKQAFEGKLVGG
ncbi:restriction endonuclease subunit S [Leptospira sp. WS4.C2]